MERSGWKYSFFLLLKIFLQLCYGNVVPNNNFFTNNNFLKFTTTLVVAKQLQNLQPPSGCKTVTNFATTRFPIVKFISDYGFSDRKTRLQIWIYYRKQVFCNRNFAFAKNRFFTSVWIAFWTIDKFTEIILSSLPKSHFFNQI